MTDATTIHGGEFALVCIGLLLIAAAFLSVWRTRLSFTLPVVENEYLMREGGEVNSDSEEEEII